MGWEIDAKDYERAAKQCHDLATTVLSRVGGLHKELTGSCTGMAGDYSTTLQWISDYESATVKWVSTGTLLSDALNHYGDVLAAMAYNWDIVNQTLPVPDPPVPTAPSGNPYTLPHTAKGSNGDGLEIKGVGLSKVEPIPNGDTDKLLKAKDQAWLSQAVQSELATAGDRIKEIGYNFDHSAEDNVDDIKQKLKALQNAAEALADASELMESSVGEYGTTLGNLRSSIKQSLEQKISSVTVTVEPAKIRVVCAAPIFSKDLEDPVYTTVTTSKFSVVVISLPFAKLPDLDFHASQLQQVIAVKIILTEENSGAGDSGGGSSIPPPSLNAESEAYVRSKHYPGGSQNTVRKSTFHADEDPYALVAAAANSPAIDQGDGSYMRVVTVPDRYIGNESKMRGAAATQTYVVIQDRFGGVLTMHPAGDG
ncbi:apolipoprotein A1/A4/E family protein [Nocardia huaxiensis]|uniref:Apolipoprotein A1/A4/E family protein n=1 Tax=Nocardia huaxiensis TaxID=2755382 RepID=A0A7D6ZWE5_9NOCA|nr:apolipoprotein A1/A4/E family protein [Nocardia huaxiensis]QLY30309.1 apolipoprotein A1/A4/E family protein [Nocardia huaxiensis]UFS96057.1 apolipoprotein A1/A4/E family protein [Nocardia huaxiensis]